MKKGYVYITTGEDQLALDFAALDGPEVVRKRLESGDAAFVGTGPQGSVSVGIERKKYDDLIRSWASGSLADQLRRMLETYDVVVLLQEGEVRYDQTTRKVHGYGAQHSADALMNDLQTWQHEGVKYQVCDEGDCGRRLWSLYHYYQKLEHHATRKGRIKRSSETPLLNVPGIGPKRAERLLESLLQLKGGMDLAKLVLGSGKTYRGVSKVMKEKHES